MEGWVNAPGSGILLRHPCCRAEWLTGCLSAQRTGMIGSWPAENGLASFTYIHISQALSRCVCVCVCSVCSVCVRICKSSNAFDIVRVLVSIVCVYVCVVAIVQHPDVSAASLRVCH